MAEYDSDHLIYKHFGINWLELQTHVDWGTYICLFASSLKIEEEDTYQWWVNSQQDPKKFKWHYITRSSKEYLSGAAQSLMNIVKSVVADPNLKNPIKGSGYEYAKATDSPIVYIKHNDDGSKSYFDEQMQSMPKDYDGRRDRESVIISLGNNGK